MNKKAFVAAITELGSKKGLSNEFLVEAIQESFQIAVGKKFEDEFRVVSNKFRRSVDRNPLNKEIEKLPTAHIRTEVDLKTGKINVFHQWEVVAEDDIVDDFLQISNKDVKFKNAKLKIGDFYEEEFDFDTLGKGDVTRFITNFKQKIAKAEKEMLLEAFKSKIGNIITGTVEKADGNIVMVNLGKTSAVLGAKDLIGDEKYRSGDPIKVYVVGIGKDDKKSSLIQVSRSHKDFLRKLFENEVNEIYDKTVIIKDIARRAGQRAKVVVYSTDPNVDASGACIGKGGERIQKIVSQLGNAKDEKEKIDIVQWHSNTGLYLSEILKPGRVLGVNIDQENKRAVVITTADSMKLAIGLRGQNVNLAKDLTGLEDIRIIDETMLEENNITSYTTLEQLQIEDEIETKEEERRIFREESIRQRELLKSKEKIVAEINPESFVDKDEDEGVDLEEEIVNETTSDGETSVVIEEETTPIVEDVIPTEVREVKTTTTLESLEKALEEEKKNKINAPSDDYKKPYKKRVEKKTEKKVFEEEIPVSDEEKKNVSKMDIYTAEELAELDNEDVIEVEEDWSEYDSDDYYEEK